MIENYKKIIHIHIQNKVNTNIDNNIAKIGMQIQIYFLLNNFFLRPAFTPAPAPAPPELSIFIERSDSNSCLFFRILRCQERRLTTSI
jgi:hypothetical protein